MADALIPRMPARSMGLKLLLVCFLALLMSIPALFVFGLLNERTQLAEQVTAESSLIGGPQTFVGPILAAPYTVRAMPGAPVSAPCSWEEMEKGTV